MRGEADSNVRRARVGRGVMGGLALLWLLAFCWPVAGQEADTGKPETPWWQQVPVTDPRDAKSPFWAAVSSALLPGGGQFYTDNKARGLVFFFTQGTLLSMTLYEHVKTEDAWRRFQRTRDWTYYDDYSLHFDRRYSLLWWDAAVWFLSAADAYVGAHMHRFDEGGRVALAVESVDGTHLTLHLSLGF